jgi:hypothetical protein
MWPPEIQRAVLIGLVLLALAVIAWIAVAVAHY